MLKRGIVQEGRRGQVRVRFPDQDIVSPWLDVATSEARGGALFQRPRPGNMVACIMDTHGETGVVIGALYNDADVPPGDADDAVVQVFGDGTRIAYDEGSGTLEFSNAGGFAFSLSGGTLNFTGDLVIKGGLAVDGDLNVTGSTALAGTTINNIPQTGS